MAPGNIEKARRSTLAKPAVRSASAMRKLESSLRQLGADDETVAVLTGANTRRRARPLPS